MLNLALTQVYDFLYLDNRFDHSVFKSSPYFD